MNDNTRSVFIRVEDVEKSFRQAKRVVHALRGVNLDISSSGFYAIMGPSGSGKSTLLHLLAGLDKPDRGTIEVAGCRLETMNERELTHFRRRKVGIVFQQFNLISTLTALENVTLPGVLDGMPQDERDDRGHALLKALGLTDRASHRPDALSGGEQQRVAIARALFFEPSVLFADEPTGNLDSHTSSQVFETLENVAQEKQLTVVMVTHEPTAAVHCRRVFLIRDGAIETSFDVDETDPSQLAARAQHAER